MYCARVLTSCIDNNIIVLDFTANKKEVAKMSKMVSFRLSEEAIKKIEYMAEAEQINKTEFFNNAIENYFFQLVNERSASEEKKTADLNFLKSLYEETASDLTKRIDQLFNKLENGNFTDEEIKKILDCFKVGGEK